MNITTAVSELVVEKRSRDVELSTENNPGTALAPVQYGKHFCTHFRREGHTAGPFFHKPGPKWYKKCKNTHTRAQVHTRCTNQGHTQTTAQGR